MQYQVKKISSTKEISDCPRFHITHFNWGGDYRPVSYGHMGFLENEGLYVEMTSEETPVCTHTAPNSNVYLDSAMEVFLCFTPEEELPVYMNFEMNAAGVLLAAYGNNKLTRTFLSDTSRSRIVCEGHIDRDSWSLTLLIPFSSIQEAYPCRDIVPDVGTHFTCNFYKIKESEGNMHFASFAPIDCPSPCFHLPEFFADAVIIE